MASFLSDIHHEVDKILGRPFHDGGRGPKTFDCMGVCLYLARVVQGLELRDPVDLCYSPGALLSFREQFQRVELDEIEPMDWLHMRSSHRQHVAIVEDMRYAVEATKEAGVIRTSLVELLSESPRAYRVRWSS